jgi:hypothetical protein
MFHLANSRSNMVRSSSALRLGAANRGPAGPAAAQVPTELMDGAKRAQPGVVAPGVVVSDAAIRNRSASR